MRSDAVRSIARNFQTMLDLSRLWRRLLVLANQYTRCGPIIGGSVNRTLGKRVLHSAFHAFELVRWIRFSLTETLDQLYIVNLPDNWSLLNVEIASKWSPFNGPACKSFDEITTFRLFDVEHLKVCKSQGTFRLLAAGDSCRIQAIEYSIQNIIPITRSLLAPL